MNLLAHLYLSPDNPEIMLGNFFADHIKGNKFKHYSEDIQKGVMLHRAIDTFTDSHTTVKTSKRRLHERYGHYDGIIIDIFYDHFLAINWHKYSQIPLNIYTNSVYKLLRENENILPEKTKQVLPYLIQYNWLYNYKNKASIKDVLLGMDKRTNGRSQMHMAIQDLNDKHEELEADFHLFFNELIQYHLEVIRSL